ncbi:7727_t:CDS:1, partial [Racocetra fulgida]
KEEVKLTESKKYRQCKNFEKKEIKEKMSIEDLSHQIENMDISIKSEKTIKIDLALRKILRE